MAPPHKRTNHAILADAASDRAREVKPKSMAGQSEATIADQWTHGQSSEEDVLRRNRQFWQDPDRSLFPLPANTPVTPAIRMFIAEKAPFEIDGDLYFVDAVMTATGGRQADVLILRGHEYMRCPERSSVRAIQVRDLEEYIDQDRVDIPFARSAKHYNLSRGWCRGGRTRGSLGITLGRDV